MLLDGWETPGFLEGYEIEFLSEEENLEQNKFIHDKSDRFLITNQLPTYKYLSFPKMLSKSPFRFFPGYSSVDPYMPKFPFLLRL